MSLQKRRALEDDNRESVKLMVRHRIPWLIIGLLGGICATVLSSHFEELLTKNIQLSFFIPVIVYMADAVGTQTESVIVRNLARNKVHFMTYLFKEFFLGIILGVGFSVILGTFAFLWFHSWHTAITVSYALFITMSIAPVVALLIPELLWKEHTDPAIGSGPFSTVIQDLLSLLVYFFVATMIILY
jgi:magnesium transporter